MIQNLTNSDLPTFTYNDITSVKKTGSQVTFFNDDSYIVFDFKIDEIADYISNNFKCFTSWTHLHEEIQKLEEQTSL
jgi:hypothetical protein